MNAGIYICHLIIHQSPIINQAKQNIHMAKQYKKNKKQNEPDTREPLRNSKTRVRETDNRGSAAMTNWVLVFLAVLPFVFHRMNMDPVLSLRFTVQAIFILAFVIYFYAIRRKLFNNNIPMLVKVAFLAGIAYGIWNFIGFSQAVNKQQVYYGLARHFLDMIMLFIFTNMAEQEEKYLVNVCKVLTVVGLIHFIIGLSQFYDGAFTDIPGNFPPYSIMANRNFYGSAQVMLLPFAAYVLYKSSMGWKITASASIIGILGSALLSQTRASWIAATIMIIVSLVLVLIYSREIRKKWLIGTVTGFAVALLLGLFLVATDQQGEFAASIKDRASNMFTSDPNATSSAAGNVSERLKIWSKTMEVIKDNPIMGVGQGNWKITVAKYGSEGLAWEKGNYIPDSSHNDYLQVTAESGIVGAILYFGMWILIGWLGFMTIRKTVNPDRRILAILVFAGLAGYAFDSLFSFPMERIEHTVYLYLSGGILLGLYLNEFAGEKRMRGVPTAAWALMIAIAGFCVFLGFKKMSFEKYVIRSKSLEEQKIYDQSIIDGNKGKNKFVTIAPNGFPIEAYVGLSHKGLKNFPEALKEMREGLKYQPYNKALYVNIGTTYTDMGKHDSAIKYYDLALRLTPKMDIIFFNKAASLYMLKDYKGALDALKKADLTGYPNMQSMKTQLESMVDTTGSR